MLSTISLFVSFRFDGSDDNVQSDRAIKLNPVGLYVANLKS